MEMCTPPRQSFPTFVTSTPSQMEADLSQGFPILSLPHCVLQVVLGYLTYDQVAQMRIVSRAFDQMCKRHLTLGFRAAERFHSKCLKEVKAKLPRRESVRKSHPFSRHSDILTAIETRISLLSMTFMKYVEMNLCCFIPGKVIDEIYRVLRLVKEEKNPPRAYEILQELRDISSMAMEHFDEKIVPTFKVNLNCSSPSLGMSPGRLMSPANFMSTSSIMEASASTAGTSHSSVSNLVQDVMTVQHQKVLTLLKKNKKQFSASQNLVASLKTSQSEQQEKITSLEKTILTQDKLLSLQSEKMKAHEVLLAAQTEKLKETETRLAELSQVMLEYDRKLSELNQIETGEKRKSDPTADPEERPLKRRKT